MLAESCPGLAYAAALAERLPESFPDGVLEIIAQHLAY